MNEEFGGGLNASDGFPLYFATVSQQLGRYDGTWQDAIQIKNNFPVNLYPRVLDICCGFGRMAGAMHQLGYLSSGVDLSSEQISLARSKNPGPNYQVGDMACLPAGTYDLLLNLYTSFGYYKSEQEDLSILSQWRQSLRPGGVLLMELADMDRARNRIPPNGELNRHTGDVEEVLLMDWSARLLTVEYLSGKHQWKCITRLYEKEVLRNSLLNAGFSQVELFGGFDFREKANDDNLIILARN